MLALSCALLLAAAPASTTAGGDLSSMTRVLQDSAEAWSRGDLDGFMASYERSPQTAFVTPLGVVRGWEAMRDRYRRRYGGAGGLGALTFSDLEETRLGPDHAILYGRFHLLRPGTPKEATGVFDLVMHRTPDGWRILSDHTS